MSTSDRDGDDRPPPPSNSNSIPAPLPPPRVSSPLAPRRHRSGASATSIATFPLQQPQQPSGTSSSIRVVHTPPTRPLSRMSDVFNPTDALDDRWWDVDDVDRQEHLSEIFSTFIPAALRQSGDVTEAATAGSSSTLPSAAPAERSAPPQQSQATLTFDQLLGAVPRPPRPLPEPRSFSSSSRNTSHLGPVSFRPSALGMSFPNNRIDSGAAGSSSITVADQPHPWTAPLETARLAGYTGDTVTRETFRGVNDYETLSRLSARSRAATAETARQRWNETRDRERLSDAQRQHLRDLVAPTPPGIYSARTRTILSMVSRARPSTGDTTPGIGSSAQQLYGSRNSNERMATTMLRRRRTETDRSTEQTTTTRITYGFDPIDIDGATNHIWDQLGDPDADSDDDDAASAQGWGIFREGEPVPSTRDADDSLSILPTALDDISLDGWGGNAEGGATLSRGRFNRRRQSVLRSADESDDFAIDFTPRIRPSSYAPTNIDNVGEPVVVGGTNTISTLGRRRRSGGAVMEATKPDERQDVPAMAKRRRKDLPDAAPARPTYLSFTALPLSAVLPNEFVTPPRHSKLELSTRDTGDLPNRPVVTFAPKHKGDNGDDDACSILTTRPIPSGIGVHYYEVEVLSLGKVANLTVGWMTRNVQLSRLVGWDQGSWGWHGDDGKTFEGAGTGTDFSPAWSLGDILGCGVDYTTGRAFFTRNGELLGHAFSKMPQELYPAVGMRAATESLAINFTGPFKYDIESHVAAISAKVRDSAIARPRMRFSSFPYGKVPRLAELASEEPQSVNTLPADAAAKSAISRFPAGSPLNDSADRAAAAFVFDYLRTQGHDHVLSLLASSMAERGMIKPREPTSPAASPMDAEDVITSTKDDFSSAAAAVLAATTAIAGSGAIPWSLLESLDPELVPKRESRLAILDFAALAARAGSTAAASASPEIDMDVDDSESAQIDTDMDHDLNDLDVQVLSLGQDLRRRSQAEHWPEADARLLEHAATLLIGPSALASEVIQAARAEEAEKIKQRLRATLGLKSRSKLETAITQMSLVTEALGAAGDGSATFVSVDSVIKPQVTQKSSPTPINTE
ncbi:Ran-binding protein 10 [Vanrija pseudolonga]|uniref:Ran-binding protein 10 n=1 Tax=Vanrija pseudolonga TaxID=143232 RepID=A0AAF0Y9V0_9TREE|nr:Ran-binding protein 10 [Vanrija pseudolonga]